MALRGFTYELLQRIVQYIGSNVLVVGWRYGVERFYLRPTPKNSTVHWVKRVSGGIKIWRWEVILTIYSKEQYSTSGQTCQWWNDDMALRGFTYSLLQRIAAHIRSNVLVVGWWYGVERIYLRTTPKNRTVHRVNRVSGGMTIWRLEVLLTFYSKEQYSTLGQTC